MTDKLREAAQQALEALQASQAITAIRAALAQQDAQAVPQGEAILEEFSAWLNERRGMSVAWVFHDVVAKFRAMLNAAPTPPAQRVMLTDEEISRIYTEQTGADIDASPWALRDFARAAIEAYERKNGIEVGRDVQEKQS